MGTSDDSFRAEGPGLFGFLTESDDDNVPVKAFGTVGYAPNVGVLGFSGVAADPEGSRAAPSTSPARPASRSTTWASTARSRISLRFRPVSGPASSARRARSRA